MSAFLTIRERNKEQKYRRTESLTFTVVSTSATIAVDEEFRVKGHETTKRKIINNKARH